MMILIHCVASVGKQQGMQPPAAEVKRGRSGNRVKAKVDEGKTKKVDEGKTKKVEKTVGKAVPKKKPDSQDEAGKDS